MTIDDNKRITWGDLKSDTLRALIGRWVVQVIRRCFFTFLPVIALIGGSFISIAVWYFQGMHDDIKDISYVQSGMVQSQARQEVKIISIEKRFDKIEDRVHGR